MTSTAMQYMILALTVSILLNLIILGAVFATGVGQRVLIRYRQRWFYKKGNHVNTIYIGNNHVGKELFVKKEEDGSFKIKGKRYSVNPLSTYIHDGIPTQINIEGIAEPINLFDDARAKDMSTAELEKIIMNNDIHDLVAALKQYFLPFCIFLFILTAFIIWDAWTGWKLYDTVVQKDAIQVALEVIKQQAENATVVAQR